MLYGLQGLHPDAPEVSSLVYALLPYIKSSMEALHPQHVSNALYGISGLFDESVPCTVMIYRYLKSHFESAMVYPFVEWMLHHHHHHHHRGGMEARNSIW